MIVLRRVLPVLLLAAVAALLVLGARRGQPREGFYSGVVETTTWDLAFEVPGRLEAFDVQEGEVVQKGAPLARLAEGDLRAALEAARARTGIAEAQLAALEAGSRPPEIAQAASRVRRARAELERLENGPTAEELEQARSQSLAAREAWRLRQEGSRREDVEAARAGVDGTRSNLDQARVDLERYRALHREGAVPTRTLEEFENREELARSQHEMAVQGYEKLARGYRPEEIQAARHEFLARDARYRELERGTRTELVEAARAEVASAESTLALVREGPRPEEIQAARRRVAEARAAELQARLNLDKARLRAPGTALVTTRNLEPGELVAPGQPALSLADLQEPWVEIFVPEPRVGTVRVGDAFEVRVDSAPDRVFRGRVRRIYEKAEYTPKSIQTEGQRVNLVFRVKVALENPDGTLKPGMPADARQLARTPEGAEHGR